MYEDARLKHRKSRLQHVTSAGDKLDIDGEGRRNPSVSITAAELFSIKQ